MESSSGYFIPENLHKNLIDIYLQFTSKGQYISLNFWSVHGKHFFNFSNSVKSKFKDLKPTPPSPAPQNEVEPNINPADQQLSEVNPKPTHTASPPTTRSKKRQRVNSNPSPQSPELVRSDNDQVETVKSPILESRESVSFSTPSSPTRFSPMQLDKTPSLDFDLSSPYSEPTQLTATPVIQCNIPVSNRFTLLSDEIDESTSLTDQPDTELYKCKTAETNTEHINSLFKCRVPKCCNYMTMACKMHTMELNISKPGIFDNMEKNLAVFNMM